MSRETDKAIQEIIKGAERLTQVSAAFVDKFGHEANPADIATQVSDNKVDLSIAGRGVGNTSLGKYLGANPWNQMLTFSGATQSLTGLTRLAKSFGPKAQAAEGADIRRVRMAAVRSVAVGAAFTGIGVALMNREFNGKNGHSR